MTTEPIVITLTADEARLIELYRLAVVRQYAEINLVIHNGKLTSAALTEKYKF